jgi:hypothetical protein
MSTETDGASKIEARDTINHASSVHLEPVSFPKREELDQAELDEMIDAAIKEAFDEVRRAAADRVPPRATKGPKHR